MSIVELDREESAVLSPLNPEQQIIFNAECYMREHGWCRHHLHNMAGEVCIVGALTFGSVESHNQAWLNTITIIEDALGGRGEDDMSPIPRWNDNVCKDEEEALAFLQRMRELATR